jgi:catechol-2,3-dioxygenase
MDAASNAPLALNHIHLTAEEPESEMGFLVETLGFKRDPTLPGFVWLGNLQLAVAKGEPVKNPRFHLGFRMDSQEQVDGMRARLLKQGVEVTEPFANGSYYSCYLNSPAGYGFEVYADAGIPALGTPVD